MVYAGYTPAKLPTELTPLQKALKSVVDMQTLDVIAKLVYNVACCPTEEKYKSIKLTNKKIHTCIVKAEGAMDVMRQMGWEEIDEELKCNKTLTMAQFRDVEAAKDNLRKDIRRSQVAQLRAGATM
eukprot:jgi/Ulvmu1/5843/UM025_0102.1